MGGAEAVAGRKLPAVADAVAAGSLPAPAPAHTWGVSQGERAAFVLSILEGEGRDGPNQGMGDAHLGHLRRSVQPNFEWRPQWRARAVLLLALRTPF